MAIKRSGKQNTASKQKNTFKKVSFNPLKSIKSPILRIISRVLLYFIGISLFWVISLRFINPPITWLMIQRGFELKEQGKGFKLEKNWLSYDELSDNLKLAAIAGEDAHFMTHWGFDLKGIQNAIKKNAQGKKLRGGSTISQQVAKNVFLWPGRSWLRKGFETYFTVLIETFWSKKRILEVYLNVIEMGQGVYGADAAAEYYFSKTGSNLSKKQAALIIAILPNPRAWDARNPSAYVNRRANAIAKYMHHYTIPEQ